MNDPMLATLDFLESAPAFPAKLFGARDVPPASWKPEDGPCVCLSFRGGGIDYSGTQLRLSLQTKVYGRTHTEAMSIYLQLVDALQDKTFPPVHRALVEVWGQSLEEISPLHWPIVIGFFTLMAAR